MIAEDYRSKAEECERIAATINNAKVREQYLVLASQWTLLAERTENLAQAGKSDAKRDPDGTG
jgi:hypothetical protein